MGSTPSSDGSDNTIDAINAPDMRYVAVIWRDDADMPEVIDGANSPFEAIGLLRWGLNELEYDTTPERD